MSSTDSNSNEPAPENAASGPSPGSVALVAATLVLLGALVWALRPARPPVAPAPLRPVPAAGCPQLGGEFVPSNYTEVPGAPLDSLSAEQRKRVLLRLNAEPCPCGCKMSVVACRINHPQCEACRDLVQKIIAEEQGEPGHSSAR